MKCGMKFFKHKSLLNIFNNNYRKLIYNTIFYLSTLQKTNIPYNSHTLLQQIERDDFIR